MALGIHMNGNPWTPSWKRSRAGWLRDLEREQELEMSHTTITFANTLRNHISGKAGNASVEGAPFELRDTRSGVWVGTQITGRAQAARCAFCGKQFAAWGKSAKKVSTRWPQPLSDGYSSHVAPCSEAWLRLTVARWATGQLTDEATWWFDQWKTKHAKPYVPFEMRRYDYDPWEGRLPEEVADLFDHLPAKPGSDVAHALEVALIAISRVWDPA